jgi:hypothetical protein
MRAYTKSVVENGREEQALFAQETARKTAEAKVLVRDLLRLRLDLSSNDIERFLELFLELRAVQSIMADEIFDSAMFGSNAAITKAAAIENMEPEEWLDGKSSLEEGFQLMKTSVEEAVGDLERRGTMIRLKDQLDAALDRFEAATFANGSSMHEALSDLRLFLGREKFNALCNVFSALEGAWTAKGRELGFEEEKIMEMVSLVEASFTALFCPKTAIAN